MGAAAKAAAADAMRKKKKSRLEYRIQATRKMTGGKSIMPSAKRRQSAAPEPAPTDGKADTPPEENGNAANPLTNKVVVGFETSSVKAMEDCGNLAIKVTRTGIIDKDVTVAYSTCDGTAKAQTETHMAGRYLPLYANSCFQSRRNREGNHCY